MEGDECHKTSRRMSWISTHALRMEGDSGELFWLYNSKTNFYPRPPHGGRPTFRALSQAACDFYPRPPHGGRLAKNHK